MATYRHADLLRIVADACHAALPSDDRDFASAPEFDLDEDLNMDGATILSVFERLELALGITLWPALAIDLVLAGPTIGRLARILAQQLFEQTEGARHAA